MSTPEPTPPSDANDLPALSVRRPLLALVLNLLIALAGLAAILAVEVRELPNVDRPIVSVRGILQGASPETMDREVTSIVEGAVARVNGVREIQSSSEENNFRMRVEFDPSADLDLAAADVREAVSRVQRELPDNVEQLAVVKADADASPILRLAVQGDGLRDEDLARIVENDIIPELISVDGVADVTLFGDRERQLRVVLDPLRLSSYQLSASDVIDVLENAPFDIPAGSFGSQDQELLVRADATVESASEVEAIVIRDNIRIGDVAQVFFGPEDAESYVRVNGAQVVGLGIVRQAQSNTIEISKRVHETVADLNSRFERVSVSVTSDDAEFIEGSVNEVLYTLFLAVLIVIGTLWIFLGSPAATLIPCVSIPIALIGSVAAIWLLGFSINILTLLALVLATGLIVDDSIVVLENIQRRRGQSLGARAAAVLGSRQVFFAVIATSATLVSVFVPISFLPSTAGRLFREFGFVLAIAVVISSFVALTLVPALAARLGTDRPSRFGVRQALGRLGRRLAELYAVTLRGALAVPLVVVAVALVAAAGSWLAFERLDRELLPTEDRGNIFVFGTGPDGVGLSYSDRQSAHMEAVLQPYLDSGEIESLFTIVGRYDLNRVYISAPLAPWHLRERSQQEIMDEIRPKMNAIPGMRIRVYGSNSLDLRSNAGGMEVALIGNDYLDLYEAAKRMSAEIEQRLPYLSDIRISYQPSQPQLSVRIDRRRASDLGIPLDDLADTLRVMIDGLDVADLNVRDESIPIILEARGGAIDDPSDLVNLHVRTSRGTLVPLSSLVTLTEEGVANELDRHVQRRAVEIDADVSPSVTLNQAAVDIRDIADEVLPEDIDMILLGEAEALAEAEREVLITYAIAVVVVFLVLVAQFESVTSAAIVMVTVPFGIAAAIYALLLTGTSVNVYSQIGLVMMIGLMAKNGILVVEFADQLRDRGFSVREAVERAAVVRLRPIVMTMVSTVLGGLPLILSHGPGAEARMAIGWVVFGGLGLAAVFTLYLTPVVYLALARLSPARASGAGKLEQEMAHARTVPDVAEGDDAASQTTTKPQGAGDD
ncbi:MULTISPECIES: efflux RND transporter permease subunit [Thalassobaculum]|uniref:Hydrophobe/amphiphile efflux-1 (HAE1) family protein n=1 Tax=Thalassobaculum litoreum DSM 18839 TaxID=1123362 RepID=A0A8G2BLV8_9PROT|nr:MULTISPECIES: efflux RND transporter permease subunit [Thalassobaculum]SDG45847.1 hydrophobe/amphiphile efflux-1 (HAE1) family protein [Thalassobaculum litoreum DSM 18839]